MSSLANLLIFTLFITACGNLKDKNKKDINLNENSVEVHSRSYAESYNLFSDISNKLGELCAEKIQEHNQKLADKYPDSYLENSDYIATTVFPFYEIDIALTASIDETMTNELLGNVFDAFGLKNSKFTRNTTNDYSITFDNNSGDAIIFICKYNPANGAFLFLDKIDAKDGNDTVKAMIEFLPLGENKYAIQSLTERAIVTYKGGVITNAVYSKNIYNVDYTGALSDIEVLYNIYEDSIYPDRKPDDNFAIKNKDELETILTVGNDIFSIDVNKCIYLYDADGKVIDRFWSWIKIGD